MAKYGNGNNDFLIADDGATYGGTGNDIIIGNDDDNVIYGGTSSSNNENKEDNDFLYGGGGNDVIYGDSASDAGNPGGNDGNDTIYGNSGNDNIYGGKGNDELYGDNFNGSNEDGNDYVYGEEGDDYINGGNGNNYLYGGTGNDTIESGKDNDWVYGGIGNDEIHAGDGNDWVYGDDSANDTVGGSFDDTIYGDAGNDYIYGGKGEDEIHGGDDVDNIEGNEGNDTIYGDAGNDAIKGGDGKDLIDGGTDVDNIEGNEGNDEIYGGAGGDNIDGGAGDDLLYGDDEKNLIKDGNDSINGGDGTDTIYGGKGDDTIDGGAGNDKLYGGEGNNTYVFGKDSNSGGNDSIYSEGHDTIDFSQGTVKLDGLNSDKSGLKVENNDGDLVLKYGNGNDSVTIEDYFENGEDKDIYVKFKDNSTVKGGYLKDFAYTETKMKKGDTFEGTFLKDKVTGSEGDDVIYGYSGDDEITAGKGDDEIHSDGGKNTYTFSEGDGNDTIYSTKGSDTIVFEKTRTADKKEEGGGFDFDKDVYAEKKGNDLVIHYSDDDSITLKDFYKNGTSVQGFSYDGNKTTSFDEFIKDEIEKGHLPNTSSTKPFDQGRVNTDKNNSIKGSIMSDNIKGGNKTDTVKAGLGNDTVDGGRGNDKLYGEAGDDTISGGTGDDKLYGGAGENTYTFSTGDGHDTLYIDKKSEGEILDFSNVANGESSYVTFEDLKFSSKGNDLIITYNEAGNSVTLSGYLKNLLKNPNLANVKFKFAESSVSKTLAELLGGDIDIDFTGAKDKKNSFKGTKFDDYIVGGYLNDTLKGDDGNDKIVGGDGDDKLYGGSSVITDENGVEKGGNAFWFGKGSGNDTLYYTKPGKNQSIPRDFIVFEEGVADAESFKVNKSSFSRHKNDLIIGYNDNNDSLTIKDFFKHTDWDLWLDNIGEEDLEGGFENYEADVSKAQKLSDIFATQYTKGSIVNKFLTSFDDNHKTKYAGKGEIYDYSSDDKGKVFLSSSSYAEFYGGKGADYYRSTSKYAYAEDKNGGDDKYFADNFTSGIFEINDSAGSDSLIIDGYSDSIHVFFDVTKDGSASGDLYLFGDKVFDTFSKGKVKPSGFKGVVVDDYFTNGNKIEDIQSFDGDCLNNIDKIKSEIQSWLKKNKYDSAMEVFESGKKDDIKDLLALYDDNAKWSAKEN